MLSKQPGTIQGNGKQNLCHSKLLTFRWIFWICVILTNPDHNFLHCVKVIHIIAMRQFYVWAQILQMNHRHVTDTEVRKWIWHSFIMSLCKNKSRLWLLDALHHWSFLLNIHIFVSSSLTLGGFRLLVFWYWHICISKVLLVLFYFVFICFWTFWYRHLHHLGGKNLCSSCW